MDGLLYFAFCMGFAGERLSMIRIGTTDVSPDVVASTVNNIKLCASQDTPVGHGVTQAFRCGTTGRYLVVLLDQRGVLTLCGVEVFSGMYVWPGKYAAFVGVLMC